ncbi:MAG: hypothetical protein V4819_03425 [Verrucomicrobiota bacterium]
MTRYGTVYQAAVEPKGDRYIVTFAYGHCLQQKHDGRRLSWFASREVKSPASTAVGSSSPRPNQSATP